ncbi:unnamed protein product, partial [Mesorhabditis belari]|uniref:Uncharacterized protein n=1 Tax=Mesorhabditis belari TaxID=2138241 RepID=A0AAF3FJ94_9BILA
MPLPALFDEFSKSIIYVNAPLAFVMNVTLLYFIVFHSKKHMGTYKYLMLCFSAFNLLYCTMHIVVMPNFHAKGGGFVVIPTSFLKFSMKAGYWGCVMYGCLFIQSLVLLAFHFVYRYLLICKNDWLFVFNSWKYVPIHFSIWLTVGILWTTFVSIYMYHGKILTAYFQYELWEIYRVDLNKTPSLGPLYKYPNALGVEVWNWGVLMATGVCVSELCGSFSVILFCTWKIHHFFKTSASTMSDKSRSLQMQLFRALLIQTVIPGFVEKVIFRDAEEVIADDGESLLNEKELKRQLEVSRQVTTAEVLAYSKGLDDSSALLYEAPAAVLLMNNLAVITASVSDTKLEKPVDGFKHLKHEWFHVSLLQVAISITDGFRYSHSSMITIEQALIDLPRVLTSTIRYASKANDPRAISRHYNQLNRRLKKAVETCRSVAVNTTNVFERVLDEIAELQQGTLGANSRNQIDLQQRRNESIFWAQREVTMREMMKRAEERYNQILAAQKEANEIYKKQYRKTGHLGRMLLAAVIDVFSSIGLNFSSGSTSVILGGNDQRKDQGMVNEADGNQTENGNPEENQSKSLDQSNSARALSANTDIEKLRLARSRLDEENAREKAQFEENMRQQEATGEIMAKLQSLNLEVVDLEKTMEVMREAVQHLGKVRDQWWRLVTYFDSIRLVIENNLIGANLDDVLENNEAFMVTGIINALMLESSLRFISYCIQVDNAAKLYLAVSSKHIFPVLRGIGSHFGLKQHEAKHHQSHFESRYEKTMNDVRALVDEQKKKLNDRFEQQITIHSKTLIKAYPQLVEELYGTMLLD